MTKRQPKGIPVGGQFAESARSEADIALPADSRATALADHRATRDQVLESYGISLDDVPGLEEAWDESFASLDLPSVHQPIEDRVVSIIGPDAVAKMPEGTEYMIQKAKDWPALKEDGIRDDELVAVASMPLHDFADAPDVEDHPAYIRSFEHIEDIEYGESFDHLKEEVLFRTPSEDRTAIAAELYDEISARDVDRDQRHALAALRSIERGDVPPWHVGSDRFGTRAPTPPYRVIGAGSKIAKIDRDLASMDEAIEALRGGEPMRAESALGSEVKWGSNLGSRAVIISRKDIEKAISKIDRCDRGLADIKRAISDAEALPDGPLKDATIGSQGSLHDALRASNQEWSQALQGRDLIVNQIRNHRRGLPAEREALASAVREHRDAQRQWWASGWTGDGEAPERPESEEFDPWL